MINDAYMGKNEKVVIRVLPLHAPKNLRYWETTETWSWWCIIATSRRSLSTTATEAEVRSYRRWREAIMANLPEPETSTIAALPSSSAVRLKLLRAVVSEFSG